MTPTVQRGLDQEPEIPRLSLAVIDQPCPACGSKWITKRRLKNRFEYWVFRCHACQYSWSPQP